MLINRLLVKKSKCAFGVEQIDYIGHVISESRVDMDKQKVDFMFSWPQPTTIKCLRGLLGLAGYYIRFIQGFGITSRPLYDLLKLENFYWDSIATTPFEELKISITSASVLALPDFS